MSTPFDFRRMKVFLILWFGQFISGIGSGLGSFALGIWMYQQTQSATKFAMIPFVATTTGLLLTPVAGYLADRFNRKKVIILADSGAAVMTLTMAYLMFSNQLQPWMVYPIIVVMMGSSTLQGPAFGATVSQLVPPDQLIRAGAMAQVAGTATNIATPLLAGVLVGSIGYHGVILIDFITFLFAVTSMLIVRFPQVRRSAAGAEAESGSWVRNFLFGWFYIRQRPGLMGLLTLFMIGNFSVAIVTVLLTPLILSFASPAELGIVSSASTIAVMLGSVAISVWGGPKQKVRTIFACLILQGSILFLGGVEPSIPLITAACFVFMVVGPMIANGSGAIWQSKVEHDVQGRVFSMRSMIATSVAPLAFLVAGPLADKVFEPLMAKDGSLSGSIGKIIGIGPGRGVGLLFMTLGMLIILATVLTSLNPRVRNVEQELPDVPRPEDEHPPQRPDAQSQPDLPLPSGPGGAPAGGTA